VIGAVLACVGIASLITSLVSSAGLLIYGFAALVGGIALMMRGTRASNAASATAARAPAPQAASSESALGESQRASVASLDAWDATAAWIGRHGALPALGLITLCAALIHIHVFAGELAGDDLSFHFAESARLADCLRVGDFDFWNPGGNAGYASAYYYQALPQLASAVPAAIFGHLLLFFQLSVFLPLVLAPATAYRGMRLLGATPWQSALAAFVIAFMNGESKWGGGNAGTFNVGLYTQTWALAAAPLALGYGARWIAQTKGLAQAIFWGAFVGLCHPFAIIVFGLGLAVSVIAQLLPRLDRLAWPSVLGRSLVFVGLALLAVIPRSWVAFAPPLVLQIPGVALVVIGLSLPVYVRTPGAHWVWPDWIRFRGELARTVLLGAGMIIAWSAVWVPLLFDYGGFGGFPHRVGGEEGPGFYELAHWYRIGALLDWGTSPGHLRLAAFTWALPIMLLIARDKLLRWLWPPALFYAALLGLGPHLDKIGDDLFPAVRTLGAMQVVLALGIGASTIVVGRMMWDAPWQRWFGPKKPRAGDTGTQYGARTAIAALAAVLLVFIVLPGWRALDERVRVLGDVDSLHRNELFEVNDIILKQPPGRKQVGTGVENHWWNLLSYVYAKIPATLQMGGGGLQASPNYDFMWTNHDFVKIAWIYDAPYLVFSKTGADKMPIGETIGTTAHYEVRKLPTAGLVSPVEVIAILPPGYRNKDAGHIMALEWYTGHPTFETKRWLARFGVTLAGDEPMKDRLLAYAGSEGLMSPPDGKLIRAWHQDSPGDDADIVAEVEANKPTTFAIRESWHPRWRAYVDGNEVRVRRVTPDFPAVDVAAGKHTIELRFERPWWAQLAWFLWPGTALLAWLATWLVDRWRR
jgi:hypothetical protein